VSPPEHPAHLIPAFLHVCLSPFLNLPSLPVRFLGRAHAGRETGLLGETQPPSQEDL
jgi:hypothetical protein